MLTQHDDEEYVWALLEDGVAGYGYLHKIRVAVGCRRGDKSGEWSAWYDRMVPVADDLFDEHLRELESEGAPYAQDP